MSAIGITKDKSTNFSEWYSEIITKLKLLDYYAVSGCYIMLPLSYEMWEIIQLYINKKLKRMKVKNVYFPLLIPETYLNKESAHIDGFTPEVIWISKNKFEKVSKDEVKLCIRPTSETAIYPTFSKEIKSHSDLPLMWNQWCNVMRNEFTCPTPFIRSKEFLWQEGHCCFANIADAYQNITNILQLYKEFYENLLCVPVIVGKKIESEKFAGADDTFSIETFIPDANKFIQCATVHNLGKNFSKMFNITYQMEDGTTDLVTQTSWGLTTRSIGTAIMTHADNNGLLLAPNFAPIQIVIVPIIHSKNYDINLKINETAKKIYENLSREFRTELDDSSKTPGWKYNHWESLGVPIRIEIGPKDIAESKCVISNRITKEKIFVKQIELTHDYIYYLFDKSKEKLLGGAKNKNDTNINYISSKDDITINYQEKKIILTNLCEKKECDEYIRNNYHIKPICRPINIDTLKISDISVSSSCIICREKSDYCYLGKTF